MAPLPPKLHRAQLRLQTLSPRDDSDQGSWGAIQISAPIMVGVVLIILFAVYIIWYKRSSDSSSSLRLFSRARDACSSRFVQVFMPAHRRRKVQRASSIVTLDDTMVTPRHQGRHYHPYIRSDSTDSQTPLTDNVEFYYPPRKYISDPFRRPMLESSQQPERRMWHWWRVFRFGPQEVKSQIPSHRFQIEGPDESSVGHASLDSPDVPVPRLGWAGGLASLREQEEGDDNRGLYDRVIQIGDPQIAAHSAPMTSEYHERDAEVAMTPASVSTSIQTPAPEYSSTVGHPLATPSNLRTVITAPTPVIPQSTSASTPPLSVSPAPPKYSSVLHSNHPSRESIIHPVHSDPMLLYPGPMRAVGGNLSQHMDETHRRQMQMSTESVLATSNPMVTPSIY